jgi:uncharacterized C2H2 Zn-finger protein
VANNFCCIDDLIRPCRVELKQFALIGDTKEQEEPKAAGEYVVNSSVKCVFCEFVSKSILSMDSHLRRAHKRLSKCFECNIYLGHLADLEDHMDEIHAETPIKCMYCEEVLHGKNSHLRKHVKERHPNLNIWRCLNGKCWRQFFTEHERNTHFSRAHKIIRPTIHRCIFNNCKMSFKSTGPLTNHFKNEHNGIYFRCDYNKACASYFTNKEDMVEHFKNIHETAYSNNRIICLYCDKMVLSTKLHDHTEEYHKGKKHFRCRYYLCSTYFKSEQEQQDHDAQAHSLNGTGAKKCRLCQMTITHSNMRRHIKVNHKNESISSCKYHLCDFYGTLDELEHHAVSHEVDKMQCVYCGLFYPKEAILMHVKYNHASQAIKCTHPCRTFFLTLADRNKHILEVHSKAPIIGDNICIYCKKRFPSIGTLLQHVMQVHKHVYIKCSVKRCVMYFLKQSDHDKHFLEKHKEKEDTKLLKCLKCNYKSDSPRSLNNHYVIRHGTENLKCPKCSKVYKSQMALDVHSNRVHAQKRMKCTHCNLDVFRLKYHQRWTKCTKCQIVTSCVIQTRQHKKVCNPAQP